jgi:peptidoglycan/LPS O-acetylase OafA/YrhL
MHPVSIIPFIFLILIALISTSILTRTCVISFPASRLQTIDGLRGFLGLSVFMHHSSIWYFFVRTGRWELPPSNFYTHLGQSSVSLFFMITGFLFFTKILESRNKPFSWIKLYIFRFFRLTPIYAVAIILMLLIVAVLSDWQLHVSLTELLKGISHWLFFTGLSTPDLNGVPQTSIIVAGATWTLRYEWLFYFTLPIFALIISNRPPIFFVLISLLSLVAISYLQLNWVLMCSFLSGIVAALLVRYEQIRKISASKLSTVIIIVSLFLVVQFCTTAYALIPCLLLTLIFTLIAGGNSLFGLLTIRASRLLGDLTYSIYLLHGILLFVVFRFVIGITKASQLSPLEHWAIIFFCTPVLIIITFISYRKIELPFMHYAMVIVKPKRNK